MVRNSWERRLGLGWNGMERGLWFGWLVVSGWWLVVDMSCFKNEWTVDLGFEFGVAVDLVEIRYLDLVGIYLYLYI